MKKIFIISIALLAALHIWAESLTIYFTNDTHGAYIPSSYRTAEGNILLGGYENLYNHISTDRKKAKNSLWLDAGDQQTGSVFSSLVNKKAIGGAVVEAFNKMGLDGAVFGNHEFDQSFNNTMQLVKIARFPFISTNLIYKNTGKPITNKPFQVYRRGKLRVGVLGLTLTDLAEKVKIENVADIQVLPYKLAIERHIDELDKKTDLIILLTHNGFEADSLLATQLDERIDLIIGGHSHTYTEKPRLVNGIYLVQTGAFMTHYGKLELIVKDDRISNPIADSVCLFPVTEFRSSKKTPFSRFFNNTVKKINDDLNMVIGFTPVDWFPDKYRETAVSRWQAEALYHEYYDLFKPDLAMINCGGIRKGIPAGEITLKAMTEMLPFTNYITIFSCYGRDLSKFIEHNITLMKTKEHDIVQTHNLVWKSIADSSDIIVTDIQINNEPLNHDKLYWIVSHDYLVGQADKYLLFKPIDIVYTDDLIHDVMVRQVRKTLPKKKL